MRQLLAFSLATLVLAGSACRLDDQPSVSGFEVKQKSDVLPGNQPLPESIACNPEKGNFYRGSTTTGDVVQVNVTTGAARTFAAVPPRKRGTSRVLMLLVVGHNPPLLIC